MRALVLTLAAVCAAACGTKGPLVLPVKPAPSAAPATKPAADRGDDNKAAPAADSRRAPAAP